MERPKHHRRKGGIRFWALMISVIVHLIVLTVFGAVKFSQVQAPGKHGPAPMAKISRIKKLAEAALIIPKPKIKKFAESRFTKGANKLLTTERIFATAAPTARLRPLRPYTDSDAQPDMRSAISTGELILPNGIEFFGSFTDKRKVCYLVDCSGSMQGIFGRVRRELAESIRNLQPDQYFSIIFFGGDRLIESGNGKLIRATPQTKASAYRFIDSVRPAGKTNALAALERAVQIRDGSGTRPAVIYFLTDGFELTTEDTHRFLQKVANILTRFAPATKINTIGFWTQGDDREMLKTIAGQSGGEFIFITDDQ